MPRKPIDYSKTIIYNFICKDIGIIETYIGHTTRFSKRKTCHKNNCINEKYRDYHYKLYQKIRENGGWDNWTMTPLEEYVCENKTQALIREQYWIDKLQPKFNDFRAFRTEEQRLTENKQFRIENPEYHKKYNTENKDKINEHKRKKFTCECGCIISINHKSNHMKTQKHINFIENN